MVRSCKEVQEKYSENNLKDIQHFEKICGEVDPVKRNMKVMKKYEEILQK